MGWPLQKTKLRLNYRSLNSIHGCTLNTSAKRLFLIDQSLKDQSGHHFDYVNCLVKDAKRRAIPVVVGANREFSPAGAWEPDVTVRSTFSNTTYSPLSMLYGMQKMTRSPYRGLANPPRGNFAAIKRWYQNRVLAKRDEKLTAFENELLGDLNSFFGQTQVGAGDHLLFVTVSEIELHAIARFIEKSQVDRGATWHFQMHFDLVDPAKDEFVPTPSASDSFKFSQALLSGCDARYYTTTESLSDQFNRLGRMEFCELAYPVNQNFADSPKANPRTNKEHKPPIRLTLAGGIRREKGTKSFLAGYIQAMDLDPQMSQILKVFVQGAKKKHHLSGKQRATVLEPVPHPLPAEKYADLIRSSDIGLLNYDRIVYKNRRAGIMGEFLSCGIPVIVPSRCWLGDQLNLPRRNYYHRVFPEAENVEFAERALGDLKCVELWQNENSNQDDMWLVRATVGLETLLPYAQDCLRMYVDGKPVWKYLVQPKRNRTGWVAIRNCDFRMGFKILAPESTRLEIRRLCGSGTIPLSAVGVTVDSSEELAAATREIVRNLNHYKRTANEHAEIWNERHAPARTLDQLFSLELVGKQAA